uniref:Uncharacterized protein n=1 Tax=Avena sativa TaxID=4498 RepID=A0ACD5UV69_AVESA
MTHLTTPAATSESIRAVATSKAEQAASTSTVKPLLGSEAAAPMASFATQLVDMLYGLLERVTGYGAKGAQDEPSKLAFGEAFRTEEVVEIRSRNLPESGGSGAQVNLVGI